MRFLPMVLGLLALAAIGSQFRPQDQTKPTIPDYGSYGQSYVNDVAMPQYRNDVALPQYRNEAVAPEYPTRRSVMLTSMQSDPDITVPSENTPAPTPPPTTPAIPDTPAPVASDCPPGMVCPMQPARARPQAMQYGSYSQSSFDGYWYPVGAAGGGSTGGFKSASGGSTGSYRSSGGSTGNVGSGGSTGSYRPAATYRAVGCDNPNCTCSPCNCPDCNCGPATMSYVPLSSQLLGIDYYGTSSSSLLLGDTPRPRRYGLLGFRDQPSFLMRWRDRRGR